MAEADVPKGSNLCISTHIGRKEDEVGTLLMTIEDIKTKMRSAKPGEGIWGGVLECGDVEFRLRIFPNGEVADTVGNIAVGVFVENRGKRRWKSVELLAAQNSTGSFLRTKTYLIEDLLKQSLTKVLKRKANVTNDQFLPHETALAEENASFFPHGVLTVKAIVKIQGLETVTHTQLPRQTVTASHLQEELSDHFRKMLESHQFSDFRIICQGEVIPCQRSILAARSEIFEAMFEHNMKENETGEVEIIDLDLETVKAVLLYIYTGRVEYRKNNADLLIRAADKYMLHGLKRKIEDDLLNNVRFQNAIDMFVLGDAVHAERLRDVAKDVIVKNAVAIMKIDGWKEALGRFQNLLVEIFESVVNRKDHINVSPHIFNKSWQDYVNTHLISKGIKEGAIAGKDGNIWAKSEAFNVTAAEVKILAEKFDSGALDGLALTGFKLAGQKFYYMSGDVDRNVLRGTRGKNGVHAMRTGQTILLAVYEDPMVPSTAATITESLGDYLKNAGF